MAPRSVRPFHRCSHQCKSRSCLPSPLSLSPASLRRPLGTSTSWLLYLRELPTISPTRGIPGPRAPIRSCPKRELKLNELLEQQEKSRRERRERMVSGADLVSALRQQRRELESKCTSASARLRKIREETGFLWVCTRPPQCCCCCCSDGVFCLSPCRTSAGRCSTCSGKMVSLSVPRLIGYKREGDFVGTLPWPVNPRLRLLWLASQS